MMRVSGVTYLRIVQSVDSIWGASQLLTKSVPADPFFQSMMRQCFLAFELDPVFIQFID